MGRFRKGNGDAEKDPHAAAMISRSSLRFASAFWVLLFRFINKAACLRERIVERTTNDLPLKYSDYPIYLFQITAYGYCYKQCHYLIAFVRLMMALPYSS